MTEQLNTSSDAEESEDTQPSQKPEIGIDKSFKAETDDDVSPQETPYPSNDLSHSQPEAEGGNISEEHQMGGDEDDNNHNEDDRKDQEIRVTKAEETRKRFDDRIGKAEEQVTQEQEERNNERKKEFDGRIASIIKINQSELERIRQLYVEPKTYTEFSHQVFIQGTSGKRQRSESERIWLVAGPPRSGRMMTAIRLALDLMALEVNRAESVWLYNDKERSLQDIVAERSLPIHSVIIFENVFKRGKMSLEALISPFSSVKPDLRQRKVWFIFTVPEHSNEFPLNDLAGLYPIFNSEQPDLTEVFRRLVDMNFPEEVSLEDNNLLKKLIKEKPEVFESPRRAADLDYWFRSHGANAEYLIKWIKDAKYQTNIATREWFDTLPNMNYKLYALLVVLFDGLDAVWLEQIYEASVARMRELGMDSEAQFIDPRRIGIHEFDNQLRLRRRGNRIDLADDAYRMEVGRQIANYHRLLWTLADDFVAVIKVMSDNYIATRKRQTKLRRRVDRNQEDSLLQHRFRMTTQEMDGMRYLREVIASALANIGISHRDGLRTTLDELAHNEQTFVVLTAGEMLAQIAGQNDNYDLVIFVLSEWTRSGDFDLMWASAVSISRVYERIARQYPPEDAEIRDLQPKDSETERRRLAAHDLLAQLCELLAELAKNYDQYSDEYSEVIKQNIYESLITQLRVSEEFTELIQNAVLNQALPAELLTIYQTATPEDRVRLALQLLPEEKSRINQAVEDSFEKLHATWCDQIRLSVVNAIKYIASRQPTAMAVLLENWMQNNNTESPMWQVGLMAINGLFKQTDHLDALLLEKRAYPLLRLFKTLLRANQPSPSGFIEILKGIVHHETFTVEERQQHREVIELLNTRPLNTALQSLLGWYRTAITISEEDDEDASIADEDLDLSQLDNTLVALADKRAKLWEEKVYPELLRAINHATHAQREKFRKAIVDIWLVQERRSIGRILRVAHALIAHSHVMDGTVLDLPQHKRMGVLIVDCAATDEQISKIFAIAQEVAALVPLQVMRLGDARQRFIEGTSGSMAEHKYEEHYFTIDDLSQRGQRGYRRPALIMPLLQPHNSKMGITIEAENTCFVVIHSTTPIVDLDDFLDNPHAASPLPATSANIFAQAKQEKAIREATASWEWAGKLFVLSPELLSTDLQSQIFSLPVDESEYICNLLQQQITKMLHQITHDEMWIDLQEYSHAIPPRSPESLRGAIEEWLPLLGNIQYMHPHHDLSLTIAWSIMVLSRSNCDAAVSIIESMLEGDSSDESIFIRHQMGMACARMLFNFYNADSSRLTASVYGPLLRLLPAFHRTVSDYTDLIPLWTVLMTWARLPERLTTLLAALSLDADESDGANLLESINNLRARDAQAMRKWLERYDRLSNFLSLLVSLSMSVDEFVDLIPKLDAYRRELNNRTVNKIRQGRKPPHPKPPVNEPQLSTLLSFVPEDLNIDNPEVEVIAWCINQVNTQYRELLTPSGKASYIRQARNMQILAQQLRDQLGRRLAGKLPEFKGAEKLYGVIIVQGNHRKLTAKAAELAYTFAAMRKDNSDFRNVVLTIHRQGTQDLVRSIRSKAKRRDTELFDPQQHLPLIGPALERYTNSQVGFIVVMSSKPVLDYDDWGETEGWAERLWTIRPATSKWQPSSGEHLDMDEKPEVILGQIASRIA